MLLVYTHKITPRLTYVFKHCFTRLLDIPVSFTTKVETFIAHEDLKLSYTNKQLGNELHIKSSGLLFEQGISVLEIKMISWEGVPAFFQTGESSAIPFDVFSATFYLLSRYEEYLPHVKDVEGRFPASESLAVEHGFLELPLVDLWMHHFKALLKEQFTFDTISTKKATTKVVIDVKRVFQFKKVGLLRAFGGYCSDFLKFRLKRNLKRTQVLLGLRKDPYDIFNWLVQLQKRTSGRFQYFFAMNDYSNANRTIKYSKVALQSLLKMVADYSDVGLLVSKEAATTPEVLKNEKLRLEAITHRSMREAKLIASYMQLPETYQYLLDMEVVSDYSMYYPNNPGFRASTCSTFLFYDLNFEIQTPLQLYPVCLHIDEIFDEHQKTIDQIKIDELKNIVTSVNGLFMMTFSNTSFIHSAVRNLFKSMVLHEKRTN